MEFPYHKQETNYTCGPASMRMALEFFGIKRTEKQIASMMGTNKVRGTWRKFFPRIAERFKLNYVVKRNAGFDDIRKLMKGGYVVIVLYFHPPSGVDHYSVVKEVGKDRIVMWDPSFLGNSMVTEFPLSDFEGMWKVDPRFDDDRRWFFALKKP